MLPGAVPQSITVKLYCIVLYCIVLYCIVLYWSWVGVTLNLIKCNDPQCGFYLFIIIIYFSTDNNTTLMYLSWVGVILDCGNIIFSEICWPASVYNLLFLCLSSNLQNTNNMRCRCLKSSFWLFSVQIFTCTLTCLEFSFL